MYEFKKVYESKKSISSFISCYLDTSSAIVLLFVCFAIAIQGSKKSVTLQYLLVFRGFLVLSFQVESPNFSQGRTSPKRYFLKPKSEQKSHIFFQITRSTPQVVHLRTTQWTTAGNYRCEVTAEDFETASKSVKAIVVGKFLEAIIITLVCTTESKSLHCKILHICYGTMAQHCNHQLSFITMIDNLFEFSTLVSFRLHLGEEYIHTNIFFITDSQTYGLDCANYSTFLARLTHTKVTIDYQNKFFTSITKKMSSSL